MHRIRLVLAACLLAARLAPAQATVVDEGSFTISRDGNRIGREDFSIRYVPTTAGAHETLTRGVAAIGNERRTIELSADSAGLPARFQSKTVIDGRTLETYRAELAGRRLSARSVREDGESARELFLPAGALVVDDGILHLLQFVVARGATASLPAMVPSRGVVVTLSVENAGSDHVSIALQTIEARRFIVREGAAGQVREVWIDRAGRVLKVAIPAQHLVAIRDEPPSAPAR